MCAVPGEVQCGAVRCGAVQCGVVQGGVGSVAERGAAQRGAAVEWSGVEWRGRRGHDLWHGAAWRACVDLAPAPGTTRLACRHAATASGLRAIATLSQPSSASCFRTSLPTSPLPPVTNTFGMPSMPPAAACRRDSEGACVQCSAVQCSAVQCMQCSAVQCSAVHACGLKKKLCHCQS